MNYHEDHEKRALDALAADMGLHDGANRDAGLGLPTCDPVTVKIEPVDPPQTMSKHSAWLEMIACAKALGLDRFRSWSNLFVDVEGLPLVSLGPDSTRRLDAMTKPDRYGVVLAREFDAYARLLGTLTTREQEDALTEYEEAIDASRRARNELKGGGNV